MNNKEVIEVLGNYLQFCKNKVTTITFFLGSGASVPIPIISNLMDYIIDWISIKNLVMKVETTNNKKRKVKILEDLWNNWLEDSNAIFKIISENPDSCKALKEIQDFLEINEETARYILEKINNKNINEVLHARVKLIEISALKNKTLDEENIKKFIIKWISILKSANFSYQVTEEPSEEGFSEEDIRCLGLLKELLKESSENNKKYINIEHLLTLNKIVHMISKNDYTQKAYKNLFAKLLFANEKGVEGLYIFRDFENLSKTLRHLITNTTMLFLFSNAQIGHKKIVSFIEQLRKDFGNAIKFYFITTNYDLGIEIALCEKNLDWQYINSKIPESNKRNKNTIIINKIHGSVNLLICPKCNKTKFLPETSKKFREKIEELEKLKENYLSNNKIKFMPKCECGNDSTEFLIIAPATIKEINEPVLYTLSDQARHVLTESDIVFAIGYGFSDGDLNIIKLIQTSINTNIEKNRWVPYVIASRSDGAYKKFLKNVRSKKEQIEEDVIALFVETLTENIDENLFNPLMKEWCFSKKR